MRLLEIGRFHRGADEHAEAAGDVPRDILGLCDVDQGRVKGPYYNA